MGADVENHPFWYDAGFGILLFTVYTVLLEGLFSRLFTFRNGDWRIRKNNYNRV